METTPRSSVIPAARQAMTRSVLILALWSLFGCAGSPPEHPASLSDAAREAKKKPEKQKPLTSDRSADESEAQADEDSWNPLSSLESSSSTADSADAQSSSNMQGHLGVVTGGGSVTGHNFGGFGLFGLEAGAYEDRVGGDVAVLYIPTNLTVESGLTNALHNEMELAVDGSLRYYLTPRNTFMAVYPLVGVRWGMLFWDYAHPIELQENGITRTVRGDNVQYLAPYVGLGISPVQLRHVQLDTNLSIGFKSFHANTNEGLRNDLFPTTGFAQLRMGASYRF